MRVAISTRQSRTPCDDLSEEGDGYKVERLGSSGRGAGLGEKAAGRVASTTARLFHRQWRTALIYLRITGITKAVAKHPG